MQDFSTSALSATALVVVVGSDSNVDTVAKGCWPPVVGLRRGLLGNVAYNEILEGLGLDMGETLEVTERVESEPIEDDA